METVVASASDDYKPDDPALNKKKFVDKNDYVIYGTPIELNEEELESGKKIMKVEDQTVRDERGRRRFHGAFTGGFSAGYFNTCGSEEGWTPSAFVSTRSGRKETSLQRPESFMDDEDFSEFGIAPRKYSAKEKFRQVKPLIQNELDQSMQSHQTLRDLLPDTQLYASLNIVKKSTIGYDLMRKMGWREGRGVGEHFLASDAKRTAKIYGCALPPHLQKSEGPWLLPKEESIVIPPSKSDMFGLGYVSLRVEAFAISEGKNTVQKAFKPTGSEKKGIIGSAYGIGAFDEYDQEDQIYDDDNIEQYDFSIDPKSESADVDTDFSNRRFWHNFVKPKTKTEFKQAQFNLPLVPDNYIPRPVLGPEVSGSKVNTRTAFDSISRSLKLNDQSSSTISQKTCVSDQLSKRFIVSGQSSMSAADPVLQAKIDAARLGNYGKLTRTSTSWQPCDILCRRFNIVCIGSSDTIKLPTSRQSQPIKAPLKIPTSAPIYVDKRPGPLSVLNPGYSQSPTEVSTDRFQPQNSDKIIESSKFPEDSIVLESEKPKPSIDLFKAVFCDESDDDEIFEKKISSSSVHSKRSYKRD